MWSACPQDSISDTCLAIVEYNSWLKRTSDATVWKSGPTITNQIAADINDDTEAARNFSMGEFERLILLLSQDEDCKAALLNSGKELTESSWIERSHAMHFGIRLLIRILMMYLRNCFSFPYQIWRYQPSSGSQRIAKWE